MDDGLTNVYTCSNGSTITLVLVYVLNGSTVTADSAIVAINVLLMQGNFSMYSVIAQKPKQEASTATPTSSTGIPVDTGLTTDQIVGIVLGVTVTLVLVGVLSTVLVIFR